MGTCDVAVIGAGIAGASVAAELASDARVILIEREAQPGYHTTGRSAALFSAIYGPAPIRALTRASAPFFEGPPDGFSSAPLLSPRGALMIGREEQLGAIAAMESEIADAGGIRRVEREALERMVPLLRRGYAAAAIHETDARDIDVHALHQGYLRRFRSAGGEIVNNAEVLSIERDGDGWRIETSAGTIAAESIVNAAGAWADEIGAMAGATPIGLVPKRRTAVIVSVPEGYDAADYPIVVDIEEEFYLKPDSGRLLISPADETPSPPCDAQPDELDVAICVDRIEKAFDLSVRHIENKWAGLRSFVADKVPVAGYDGDVPGFFWLAGQGGYGIQSAPALARTAAALVMGRPVPGDVLDQRLDPASLSPARLERG
ncbi:FAD-binding oxidoreductase [Nitratireductor mangrovi]|uniref:FAD-binding oxidoreductase n=1 Tax=Nitratireductor mangrovi TaxID=2599600 RepID=A0A5B8L642_9HYPH|nr:FAD-binding oxidoreductase [Nitratireductor mangrovi]